MSIIFAASASAVELHVHRFMDGTLYLVAGSVVIGIGKAHFPKKKRIRFGRSVF